MSETMRIGAEISLDRHYKDMWNEEQSEAIWLFLLAEKAEEENLPKVASLLREAAKDELKHALWMGSVAQRGELERRSLADQIRGCMGGDNQVVARERQFAAIARALGREKDAVRFEQMAEDEIEHVRIYQEAIQLLEG